MANLFTAIAYAERVHAINHYQASSLDRGDFSVTAAAPFGFGSTSENLQTCINGETFEINEMYPVYKATAEMQGERRAQQTFNWALESEKNHLEFYKKAKEAVDQSRDIEVRKIQVCEVCGYTVEEDAPEICPVCNARKDKFKLFPAL